MNGQKAGGQNGSSEKLHKGIKKVVEVPNPDAKVHKILVIKGVGNSTKNATEDGVKFQKNSGGKVVLEKDGSKVELVRASKPAVNGTKGRHIHTKVT